MTYVKKEELDEMEVLLARLQMSSNKKEQERILKLHVQLQNIYQDQLELRDSLTRLEHLKAQISQ